MAEKPIETRTSRVWLSDAGILRGQIKNGAKEKLEDACANVQAASKIAGGRKVPVLIDMRGMKSVSSEARAHYGSEIPAAYSLAQALLVGSLISRVIGNFFLGINKPPFPIKMFTSESEALDWLEGFIK